MILIEKQIVDLYKELDEVNFEIRKSQEILRSQRNDQIDGSDLFFCRIKDASTWDSIVFNEKRKNEIINLLDNHNIAQATSLDTIQVGSLFTCINMDGEEYSFVLVDGLVTHPIYNSWTEGDVQVKYASLDGLFGKAIIGHKVGDVVDYITPNKQINTMIVHSIDNKAYLPSDYESEKGKQLSLGFNRTTR